VPTGEKNALDLTPWNPWQELERVQGQVDDLLASVLAKLRNVVPGKEIAFVPATDIIELAEEYRLYFSLPGLVEEDIDIALESDVLIVRGEREAPYGGDQVAVHQAQWKYGYFERRIQLPRRVDGDSIQASYDAGVLTIRVPKAAAEEGEEKRK
jgi:HSP20 family protein